MIIALAVYLFVLCLQRAVFIWRQDPIDLVAWGIFFAWAIGAVAAALIVALEVL